MSDEPIEVRTHQWKTRVTRRTLDILLPFVKKEALDAIWQGLLAFDAEERTRNAPTDAEGWEG